MSMAVSMWRTFVAMTKTKPEKPGWAWSFTGAKFLKADRDHPDVCPDRWVFDIGWLKLDA